MKTLREAIEAVWNDYYGGGVDERFNDVMQKHLAPLLAPPPDTRKAEVARIAELIFIRYEDAIPKCCFDMAEKFVTYKESL